MLHAFMVVMDINLIVFFFQRLHAALLSLDVTMAAVYQPYF